MSLAASQKWADTCWNQVPAETEKYITLFQLSSGALDTGYHAYAIYWQEEALVKG